MGKDVTAPDRDSEEVGRRGGIQSIEVGAPLLRALVAGGRPMTLTQLAHVTGMPVSKAHKYLASFVRIELMSQSPAALYSLGPFARELGLAALRRNDVIDHAQEFLDELNVALSLTASMAVWSDHGPVVVRKTETRHRISLVVPLGTALPVLSSSNGRIFAAYGEPAIVGPLVQQELGAGSRTSQISNGAELAAMVAEVRARGVAATEGLLTPGVSALSAPVFDGGGKLAASLTVLGFSSELDTSASSAACRLLIDLAARLSRLLGAPAMPHQADHARRRKNATAED